MTQAEFQDKLKALCDEAGVTLQCQLGIMAVPNVVKYDPSLANVNHVPVEPVVAPPIDVPVVVTEPKAEATAEVAPAPAPQGENNGVVAPSEIGSVSGEASA